MTGATAVIGAPIVRKDSAERVVTAPVLVPDEPDRERHRYTRENIRELAEGFLPSGEIDAMHTGGAVGHPTENYVAQKSLHFEDVDRTIPAGSWMVSLKITDDDVWAGIVDGTYRGVSVFGPIRRVLDESGAELGLKETTVPVGRTTRPPEAPGPRPAQPAVANSFGATGIQREIRRAPVGETWTVLFDRATHISIVDDPAIQSAFFVAAKSFGSGASAGGAGTNNNNQQPIMDDEFKERFDDIQAAVQKSAEAAEASQQAAEEAQSAAEEAVEGDTGGTDDDTGFDGPDIPADLSETDYRELQDLAGEWGITATQSADELRQSLNTLRQVTTDDGATGAEKRFAAIEKKLDRLTDDGVGRRGSASQLDGVGGESGLSINSGRGGVSKAIAGGNAGNEDGDDE